MQIQIQIQIQKKKKKKKSSVYIWTASQPSQILITSLTLPLNNKRDLFLFPLCLSFSSLAFSLLKHLSPSLDWDVTEHIFIFQTHLFPSLALFSSPFYSIYYKSQNPTHTHTHTHTRKTRTKGSHIIKKKYGVFLSGVSCNGLLFTTSGSCFWVNQEFTNYQLWWRVYSSLWWG